jgi:EmrB/QacA subfamily drug resistance transporter
VSATAVIDYSRRWFVMAGVATATFLSTIDGSIVNVALPTLVRELGAPFAAVQWVVLAYLLTQTTLILSVGRLGDMLGKKPIFTAGVLLFTLSSVLCGLAPTVYWLIGFRALQAVGAAMALALGMAIVTEAFPPAERGKALGMNGTFVSVGVVIGPTLGGLILDAFSWRWIFFVNLPIGLLGAFLAWRYIPNFKPRGRQTFDYRGAGTLFVSLLMLLLALTWGQTLGFGAPPIVGLLGGSAVFLALFLRIETRAPQPMIDLRLFRSSLFSVSLLTGGLAFVAISGATLLLPFFLDDMLGYAPRQVGLLMALIPAFLGVLAPLSGALSDRYGSRPISILGLAVLVGGYGLMSRFSLQTSLWGYALGVLPLGVGMGIFQSPNNSAIMGAAPRERLGVASGMLGLSRTLGQTTGVAVLGALWAGRVARYAGGVPPGGVTAAPPAAQAAGLGDTYLSVAGLMAVALALSLWALRRERRP